MKKIISLLLILVTLSAFAFQNREAMAGMLSELTALRGYMLSQSEFTSEKNEKEIAAHLKKFTALAKKVKHSPEMGRANFMFSRDVLVESIEETEKIFRSGNKSFARWKLNSVLSICVSCHTQMPTGGRLAAPSETTNDGGSQFDRAEMLFATRAFEDAIKLYGEILDRGNGENFAEAEAALKREVAYFARIKRDPDLAIKTLKSHLKNKKLWPGIRVTIDDWISQFEHLKRAEKINPQTAGEKEVVEFARKSLLGEKTRIVTLLSVSGMLYEYLNSHPRSAATPDVLYWLAICDRNINNDFFYSLADLYLKECIVKYPASAIAPKCYEEYREQTIIGYSGSAGTNLPSDVREELLRLKALVEKNAVKKP